MKNKKKEMYVHIELFRDKYDRWVHKKGGGGYKNKIMNKSNKWWNVSDDAVTL